jgi:LmbE family N-acetylglucosaminyl deacetylase
MGDSAVCLAPVEPYRHVATAPAAPSQIREDELRAAARVLGLRGVKCLRYPDKGLADAATADLIGRLVRYIRQVRPQVVVTFGPDGLTGNPDYIAI